MSILKKAFFLVAILLPCAAGAAEKAADWVPAKLKSHEIAKQPDAQLISSSATVWSGRLMILTFWKYNGIVYRCLDFEDALGTGCDAPQ